MNADQWTEFRERFPDAAAWMDAKDLENERQTLTEERQNLVYFRDRLQATGLQMIGRDADRLTWIESRLRELNTLAQWMTVEA
jgi:hypothetical protein